MKKKINKKINFNIIKSLLELAGLIISLPFITAVLMYDHYRDKSTWNNPEQVLARVFECITIYEQNIVSYVHGIEKTNLFSKKEELGLSMADIYTTQREFKLNGTYYILWTGYRGPTIDGRMFVYRVWYYQRNLEFVPLAFEEVMEALPEELAYKLTFHMELFV